MRALLCLGNASIKADALAGIHCTMVSPIPWSRRYHGVHEPCIQSTRPGAYLRMAINHALSGEAINVLPFDGQLPAEKTLALFKSEDLEVIAWFC